MGAQQIQRQFESVVVWGSYPNVSKAWNSGVIL